MISEDVFDSVRRGYTELKGATPREICDYFSSLDSASFAGHVNNIKGIAFEQEVVNALNNGGIEASMFEATNHPITDIAIFDDGEIVSEFQLKATDSVSYIAQTLEENPDVPIITTSEVAASFDENEFVLDSGISNEGLTDFVSETLVGAGAELGSEALSDSVGEGLVEAVADAAIPISPIGIIAGLFGLPFL